MRWSLKRHLQNGLICDFRDCDERSQTSWYLHMHAHTHVYTHRHRHTYTDAHMHTCIHTHTRLFPHTPLIQQTTQASSVGFTSLWSLKTRCPAGHHNGAGKVGHKSWGTACLLDPHKILNPILERQWEEQRPCTYSIPHLNFWDATVES